MSNSETKKSDKDNHDGGEDDDFVILDVSNAMGKSSVSSSGATPISQEKAGPGGSNKTTAGASKPEISFADIYDEFVLCAHDLRAAFRERCTQYKGRLFYVKPSGLATAYLGAFNANVSSIVKCSTCANFIRQYGHTVFIDENFDVVPAFWDEEVLPVTGYFRAPVAAVSKLIKSRPVIGVFYIDSRGSYGVAVKGKPKSNHPRSSQFPHLHITENDVVSSMAKGGNKTNKTKIPFEAPKDRIGELKGKHAEEVRMLRSFFDTNSLKMFNETAHLLTDDEFKQSSKHRAMAEWMADKAAMYKSLSGARKENWLHHTVSSAPFGYAHAQSSVYGNILGAVTEGRSKKSIAAEFRAMTDPTVYMRPKALPTEGNVARAEALFAEMNLAPALERRHATSAEVRPHYTWTSPALLAPRAAPADNSAVRVTGGPAVTVSAATFLASPGGPTTTAVTTEKPNDDGGSTVVLDEDPGNVSEASSAVSLAGSGPAGGGFNDYLGDNVSGYEDDDDDNGEEVRDGEEETKGEERAKDKKSRSRSNSNSKSVSKNDGKSKKKDKSSISDDKNMTKQAMTWRTFVEDVLPNVAEVHLRLSDHRHWPFYTIIAPVHADAPILFRWDTEENRNRYSWATAAKPQEPSVYGLGKRKFVQIDGIGSTPVTWFGGSSHFPDHQFPLLFVEGYQEKRTPGLCLFPEMMRNELREVRKVVESFSNGHMLKDYDLPKQKDHAIGIKVIKDMTLVVVMAKDGAKLKVKITGLK